MNRREFLAGLGLAAVALPLISNAAQPETKYLFEDKMIDREIRALVAKFDKSTANYQQKMIAAFDDLVRQYEVENNEPIEASAKEAFEWLKSTLRKRAKSVVQ